MAKSLMKQTWLFHTFSHLRHTLDRDWWDVVSYSCASVAFVFLYEYLCRAESIKGGKGGRYIANNLLVILQLLSNITYIYIIMMLLI